MTTDTVLLAWRLASLTSDLAYLTGSGKKDISYSVPYIGRLAQMTTDTAFLTGRLSQATSDSAFLTGRLAQMTLVQHSLLGDWHIWLHIHRSSQGQRIYLC